MNGNYFTGTESREVAAPEDLPRRLGASSAVAATTWRRLLPRSASEVGLLALVVLVISIQLNYLLSVSTGIPFQDDWNFLDKMFRSLDTHRVAAWLFDSPNGHFLVPAALGYLASWRYGSLDLTWLRLLNFPTCLAAFLLTAHVINGNIRSRFLRFYLYAGISFIIFNLCFWEHFAQANGFSAMLSALFGSIGVYYVAKAMQLPAPWKSVSFLIGLVSLLASVLSLGAGYAAVAAALSLVGLSRLKRMVLEGRVPRYKTIVSCLVLAAGLLALASHPMFNLKSRVIRAAFHTVLVAGSVGSVFLDKGALLAQNVAFVCGLLLIAVALLIGFHFQMKQRLEGRLLPVFATGLILFGLLACGAVAIARSYMPDGEFLNSRYTIYPSIILLGSLLYFACSRVFLLTNIWCATAAAYSLATVKERQVGFFRATLYHKMESAIVSVDHLPDEEVKASLYWRENTRGVRRVVTRMRREHSNAFNGKANAPDSPR